MTVDWVSLGRSAVDGLTTVSGTSVDLPALPIGVFAIVVLLILMLSK